MRVMLFITLIVFGLFLSSLSSSMASLIVATSEYVVTLNPHRKNITVFSVEKENYIGELKAPEGADSLYLDGDSVLFRCPRTAVLPYMNLTSAAHSIDAFKMETLDCPLTYTDLSVHDEGITLYNQETLQYITYAQGQLSSLKNILPPASCLDPRVCLCDDKFLIWPGSSQKKIDHRLWLTMSAHKLFMIDALSGQTIKSNCEFLYDIDDVQLSGWYIVTRGFNNQHLMVFDAESLKLLYTLNFEKPVEKIYLENGLEEAVYFYKDGYTVRNHITNKILKEETIDGICATAVMPGIVIYARPSIEKRWAITMQGIYLDNQKHLDVKKCPLEIISTQKNIFSKLQDTTALGYIKLPL